jgi:hypothetical protein
MYHATTREDRTVNAKQCHFTGCQAKTVLWAKTKPVYTDDLRRLSDPNQVACSPDWKQVPRYCNKHSDIDGATLVCKKACLWCYTTTTDQVYCKKCVRLVQTYDTDKKHKYEDTIVRLAETLALAFPGIITNKDNMKVYHGLVVAEGDITLDVQMPGCAKLGVWIEVDGSHHSKMVAGKDAIRAMVRARRFQDDNEAFVLFRMRYTEGENNFATVAEKVLLQSQQWMVFIIRNSSMFVKAKRTIFYHNYENCHARIPPILRKYFAVVETKCPPIPTCQTVATANDLTMARVYQAVTRAGFAADGNIGFAGILAQYPDLIVRYDAPVLPDDSKSATLQGACGLNWHNRIMPLGASSGLHTTKHSPPMASFVPMQFLATSVDVQNSPMNVWTQERPLGEYEAPRLDTSAFAAMAAWVRGIDLHSESGHNLNPGILLTAAAALTSIERMFE